MPVQFEEQQFTRPRVARGKKRGAVTNIIIKLGLAKSEQQANIVMIVVAVIAIAITAYLMWPESTTPVDTGVGVEDPTLAP